MLYRYVQDNYERLLQRINELASKVGAADVTLVAVTKSGSDDELLALARAGVTDIGENRPQELKRRGELLLSQGFSPRLHEIGNLQKNKVKLIIDKAELIHSVDSFALGELIDKKAAEIGRKVGVLVEVNSGEEENKSGIAPALADELVAQLRSLKSIEVRGIMTMGPAVSAEELRPYFRKTRRLFEELCGKYDLGPSPILSMGMSESFEVAIEEGSTLVRVGRRLFEK